MQLSKKTISRIEKEAKKYFKDVSGCHDWSHTERVRKLARVIGKKEKADLGVLDVAVLLHDIGRRKEMRSKGKVCHAQEGAKIAGEILSNLGIDPKVRQNVIHCIKSHRYRNNDVPRTIEAKVLYDADKLDSIGAVGVARNFVFAGNSGSGNLYTGNEKRIAKAKKDFSFSKEDSAILEYEIKLKYIRDKIITKTAKKIAQNRHQYMVDFYKRFWLEVEGKL